MMTSMERQLPRALKTSSPEEVTTEATRGNYVYGLHWSSHTVKKLGQFSPDRPSFTQKMSSFAAQHTLMIVLVALLLTIAFQVTLRYYYHPLPPPVRYEPPPYRYYPSRPYTN
eukprot:TRINITY_DN10366_c0_g1_i1.p1 TRINITY_DN10366_c0_g1~~TRINITY_DN10366_c0_g1_i1.p1  ORF type:complete len:113 (-),score=10.65 TRINITY_DN10366_c0_g1_i1:40-378(-)